nr:5-formyltetrahydrofolate cyclo-ligase-like [Pogona vitticeps]
MQHARYQASQRIAVFLSLPDEVQTAEIIKDIFQQGKECFIPRYQPQSNHMDMVKLASYQEICESHPGPTQKLSREGLGGHYTHRTHPIALRPLAGLPGIHNLYSSRFLLPSFKKKAYFCLLVCRHWRPYVSCRFKSSILLPWGVVSLQGSSRYFSLALSMHKGTRNTDISLSLSVFPSTEGLDLILMPGLGFDRTGNRLGRGKGYYDAYLSRCLQHPKGKPYTIALAFKEQMCESVPVSENDIKVDEVLFEENKTQH